MSVELTAGVPVASLGPSIASIYGAKLKLDGSACLTISQSGKSPDIVAMAQAARAGGALTIAITNTSGIAARRSVRSRDRHPGRRGKKRCCDQELRQLGRRRAAAAGALDRRPRPACGAAEPARTSPQGHRLRLDRHRRGADRRKLAVYPGARAIGGDRQRSGAEIQGNLRHACRGLQRGRGHARTAGAGRPRLPGCGARRARCVRAVHRSSRRPLVGQGRVGLHHLRACRRRRQACRTRRRAIRSPTR